MLQGPEELRPLRAGCLGLQSRPERVSLPLRDFEARRSHCSDQPLDLLQARNRREHRRIRRNNFPAQWSGENWHPPLQPSFTKHSPPSSSGPGLHAHLAVCVALRPSDGASGVFDPQTEAANSSVPGLIGLVPIPQVRKQIRGENVLPGNPRQTGLEPRSPGAQARGLTSGRLDI